MDENKNKSAQSECATAAIPTDLCCCDPTTRRQRLISRVYDLMLHVSDNDRCMLCEVARELEKLDKLEKSNTGFAFPLLAGILFSGLDIDANDLRICMEALNRKHTEKDV